MTSQTREGTSELELEETSLLAGDDASEPIVATADPRRKLGRYVLISELGRGGMGVVYAGYDAELDRRVAVKLIHASSRTGEARLRREAKALAQLTHPNVVTIYEVGDHEGRVYIAMEYVQGQTLKQWLKAQERSQRDKMNVLLAAAEGLQAAHTMGLVHRDFKPDNVMVGDDGRVRVMDFGLVVMSGSPSEDAVVLSEDSQTADEQSLTLTGSVMGTPRYMAPEQFMSRPTTPATDQFSFCATALEAFAGAHPIGGDSYPEIFGRVSRGYRDPQVVKQVPKWIRDVLGRGLSVTPDDRWPSMAELQAQLRQDPSRRKRVWATVGGLGVAGVGLLVAVQAERRMKAEECAQRGAELPQAWNESTRGSTQAALSAVPHLGEATAERIVPKLDEFASQWQGIAAEVCLDPGWADPQLDRQAYGCLEDARRRFEGLVQRLQGDPDITVVRAAVRATSDLPDPSRCQDRTWLSRQPQLPLDRLAEVEAIEELLSSASASASVVRYEEAQREAEVARAKAEALGWEPLMARVDLKLGEVEARQGKDLAAQRHTQRGRILALASGDMDAAIRAAAAELRMLADLDRLDDAVALRDAFDPIVERFAEPGTRSHLEWTLMRGELAMARFEFDEAEVLLSQAQTSAAQVLGEGHPQHARVWLLRASLAERRQLPHLAEERIATALEIGRAVFGADHPTVSAMRNVSAMVRFEQGKVDEGLEILEELVDNSARVLGPEHPDTLDYISNLATREAMAGYKDRARPRMELVLEVERRRAPRGSGVATALTNLGTLTVDQGRVEEGIDLLEEALELHMETTGRRTLRVANTAMNLGSFLSELGDYDRAVPHLRLALGLFEELLDPGSRPVAHIRADLAMIESRTRGAQTVHGELERARTLVIPHLGEDSRLVAQLDGHLAVSWAARGDVGRATPLLEAGATRLDNDEVDPRSRADFLINRARVRLSEDREDLARADLDAARTLARSVAESAPAASRGLERRIESTAKPPVNSGD